MKMRWAWMAAAAAIVLTGAGMAAAADDITKDPGYVDFGAMNLFGKEDTNVEIFLDQSILGMVAVFAKDDPELQEMIGKLKQIRVQTFELDSTKVKQIEQRVAEVSKKLEGQGWSTLVKVRDRKGGDNTYVYIKMKDNKAQGLAVMSINPAEDVKFVNIVGEIDPAKMQKLGSKVHIDALDSLEVLQPDKARAKGDKDPKAAQKN